MATGDTANPRSSGGEALSAEQKFKPLHRGIWAEHLDEGDELPVGGSIFSNALTLRVRLDIGNLRINHAIVNPDYFRAAYATSETAIKEMLKETGSNIDPYLFFLCQNVQHITDITLGVDHSRPVVDQRKAHYESDSLPALSSLRGISRCAERAAVAQFLFQELGIESQYVAGATMRSAHDENEEPEAHSYLLVTSPADNNGYIFDVARPNQPGNRPAILRPAQQLAYETLEGQSDLFVGSTDVLNGERLYFGVGEPFASSHIILD